MFFISSQSFVSYCHRLQPGGGATFSVHLQTGSGFNKTPDLAGGCKHRAKHED